MTNLFNELKGLLEMKGEYKAFIIEEIANNDRLICWGILKDLEEKLKLITTYQDSEINININNRKKEIDVYFNR